MGEGGLALYLLLADVAGNAFTPDSLFEVGTSLMAIKADIRPLHYKKEKKKKNLSGLTLC